MIDVGFIKKANLKDFLKELSEKYTVYAPCSEEDIVTFKPFVEGKNLCLERPANISPKSVIFPQSETLFTFKFTKKEDDPSRTDVELKVDMKPDEQIIFGARPCDAYGFRIYDRVYMESDISDPYYTERRKNTTIFTLCCETPSPGCFCVAVGGGPANREGSDVIMTEINDGYVLEPLTEKGKAMIQTKALENGESYLQDAQKRQSEAHSRVSNPFQKEGKPEISQSLFNSDEFWEQVLKKCVSCGACTFLCPTCYCFNITDEQRLNEGERVRSWDACMFPHFTLEASGHNPRPTKFQRFKNRVGHKFVYYPEKYNGVIACCGCGRCIRYCPVSVDISEIVNYLGGSRFDDMRKQSDEGKA